MSNPPAVQRSPVIPLLKTAVFSVLVPGTVGGYIPYRLIAADSAHATLGWLRYAGVLPLLFGIALYLRCAWDFSVAGHGTPAPIDPPTELVARGPYALMRNPMYVAVLSALLGEALIYGSPTLVGYALVVFVLTSLFVLLYEEPVLARKFGDSYTRYRATVPRWLPRWDMVASLMRHPRRREGGAPPR